MVWADLHPAHLAAGQMGRDLPESAGVQVSDPRNIADSRGDPVG